MAREVGRCGAARGASDRSPFDCACTLAARCLGTLGVDVTAPRKHIAALTGPRKMTRSFNSLE